MEFTHDALILGRGIAGAVLAETLLQRGLRIHVFDRKRPGNASMVAAGIVNPVVLKRDVASWRAMELLPIAEAFYTDLEDISGERFWHPLELVKLFPGEREVKQWERALHEPGTATMIDRRPQPTLEAAAINAEHGHGTVHCAAWLDVPAMLEAQRQRLLNKGMLTEELVAETDRDILPDGVRIGSRSAPWLIHCTGPFAALGGLVPVKGEGVTVRLNGLGLDRMVQRGGVFLLPKGGDQYRIGATFKWEDVWEGPTEEARNWLLDKLSRLTPVAPELTEQWSGVRPTSADRRPIIGRIGEHEAVFNGLGSRGVLLAPWCAAHLADHLYGGHALLGEVRSDRSFTHS